MMLKQWTLRIDEDLFRRLKDRHAETFVEHRLSFNSWMTRLLEDALPKR